MTRPGDRGRGPASRAPRALIRVLGNPVEVRTDVDLLSAFDEVTPATMATGMFCRKHECGTCRVYYRIPADEKEHRGRACRLTAVEGMDLTVLSPELKRVLRPVLRAGRSDPEAQERGKPGRHGNGVT